MSRHWTPAADDPKAAGDPEWSTLQKLGQAARSLAALLIEYVFSQKEVLVTERCLISAVVMRSAFEDLLSSAWEGVLTSAVAIWSAFEELVSSA